MGVGDKGTEDEGGSEMQFVREKAEECPTSLVTRGSFASLSLGKIKDGKLHSKTSLRLA